MLSFADVAAGVRDVGFKGGGGPNLCRTIAQLQGQI